MKILFVQLGCIGDMILLTPLFEEIKSKFPKAILKVLASPKNMAVLKNNPNISSIYVWDKAPMHLLKTIAKLRSNKFDYLIDPKDHFSKESALIAGLSKAKLSIGYNPYEEKNFNVSLPSDDENKKLHATLRYFNSLLQFGLLLPEAPPRPKLYLDADSEAKVTQYLNDRKIDEYVLLNISAGSKDRYLSNEKWVKVIEEVHKAKRKVVVLTSPDDLHLAEHIESMCDNVNFFSTEVFTDLFSLVNRAKVVVSPDTSIVHIASGFDVPIVALYCSNEVNFTKFSPLSSKQIVLRGNTPDTKIESISAGNIIKSIRELCSCLN